MHSSNKGYLAEYRAKLALVELGYYIFEDTSGKSPVDFIALKEDELLLVQVKFSSQVSPSGNLVVELKSTRSNRTGNTIKSFDNKAQSVLAVYDLPKNKLHLLDASRITAKSALTLNDTNLNNLLWRGKQTAGDCT
tara:strand:- start:54838 stop:55245 length:408 start_codon:yes stop_codon:yes gene_type:complete